MLSFFSSAFAADVSAAPSSVAGLGASVAGFIPLVLIFCVFYFLVIRPQQKKLKEHNRLLDSLKKGDKVVACGGILGTITKVDAAQGNLHVEIANNVEIKILKASVSEVLSKEVAAASCKEATPSSSSSKRASSKSSSSASK